MTHSSTIHSMTTDKAQEYLEGWKRARAQLVNLQSRLNEEAKGTRARIKRDLIEELLAVADNFYSLTMHVPKELSDEPWVQGVLHVSRQFDQTLSDLGVTILNPIGQSFDPLQHEAVEKVELDEHGNDVVAQVLQRGYTLDETVIRPAKVNIAT